MESERDSLQRCCRANANFIHWVRSILSEVRATAICAIFPALKSVYIWNASNRLLRHHTRGLWYSYRTSQLPQMVLVLCLCVTNFLYVASEDHGDVAQMLILWYNIRQLHSIYSVTSRNIIKVQLTNEWCLSLRNTIAVYAGGSKDVCLVEPWQ